MNYYSRPSFFQSPVPTGLRLSLLALVLVASATGCFRATGYQRTTLLATEIPVTGGDRVQGPKADAGPGDFYIGNDLVELAVDGAIYGDREAIAGAPSGGSIVDLGIIALNLNYQRTSLPVDWIDRLTPVVNQDPDISVVVDQFALENQGDVSRLVMRGGLLDPQHKLRGAVWDAKGRVQGVGVVHQISLTKLDAFFRLETTLTNASGASLGVRSLGDFLLQKGGGYRLNVPAAEDPQGKALSTWGVQIPGGDFTQPLATSVQAPMLSFMGTESGGDTLDCHGSFGLLPENSDRMLVNSDPQDPLTDFRPIFPRRVVAGSPAAAGDLANGQSLTYARRLYALGGSSQSYGFQAGLGTLGLPIQATGIQNLMTRDRASLRGSGMGVVYLTTYGTADRMGPLPAEIRFERNAGTEAFPDWRVERVEWFEPYENQPALGRTSNPTLGVALRPGSYRLVVRNREPQFMVKDSFRNLFNTDRPDLYSKLLVEDQKSFEISYADIIAPEHDAIVSASGIVVDRPYDRFYFTTRPLGMPENSFQPARFTLLGVNGTSNPDTRRQVSFASYFEPMLKGKAYASLNNLGTYSFQAGNEGFAASFTESMPLAFWLKPGNYDVLVSRGPLTPLEEDRVSAYPGQALPFRRYIQTSGGLPVDWTSFDLPAPGLGSTGGYHPAEKLSSALAEGVQVLGYTEQDRLTDVKSLYDNYRVEFHAVGISDDQRSVVKDDPFLIAGRTANLGTYGEATALFTEAPRNERYRGARRSTGWTLADFLAQGQGQFTVVHRPRGPQGLFTQMGFDPAKKLSEAPNLWWNRTGSQSQGKVQGGFDAIELLRAEYSDANGLPLDLKVPANATAWFQEFQAVRADWFALLNQQTPTAFTKALGLSGARYSRDTTVGAARTYLKASGFSQEDTSPLLKALRAGAAVASTGPAIDFTVNGQGPGGVVTGSGTTLNLAFTVTAADWVPLDELRVVVNGQVLLTVDPATLTVSSTDSRVRTGSATLTLPSATTDVWVVMEGGAPLGTSGAYRAGSRWHSLMKGLYPVVVTNPVFVDVAGDGYLPPVR